MALYHFAATIFSRSGRNTVQAVAYRAGCKLVDPQTGETFDYRNKAVEHVELVLPKDAPSWALDIQKVMQLDRQKGVQAFVDVVESAEKRMNSRVWREFEFALHRELTDEQNKALAREFVEDQICSRGMAAQLNFHFDRDEKTGEEKPHCHVNVTTRQLNDKGMGEKERDWNKKEFLCELRVQCQEYSNFHLKFHGHDIQIDHRCNKERGIEIHKVMPAVVAFLKERGLELSLSKTKITHIDEGFDFLGFNVRKYKGKLLIKPSKKNVKSFLDETRKLIKSNATMPTEVLISQLNPKIRGWANYFCHVVAKETFSYIDHFINQAILQWVKRRHPNKNYQWMRKKYFRSQGLRNWIFSTPVVTEKGKIFLDLLAMVHTPIRRHVKIRAQSTPYDSQFKDYFLKRETRRKKRTESAETKEIFSLTLMPKTQNGQLGRPKAALERLEPCELETLMHGSYGAGGWQHPLATRQLMKNYKPGKMGDIGRQVGDRLETIKKGMVPGTKQQPRQRPEA